MTMPERPPPWWDRYRNTASPQLLRLVGYQEAALCIEEFDPFIVPGLLQTPDYMRASARRLAPEMTSALIEARVALRIERQKLLHRPRPPQACFVITEPVVRRPAGGPQVMRGQLQQLIEASRWPYVTVEVIPDSAGLVQGMQAPFVICGFDFADDDVLYRESPRGDTFSRADVPEFQRAFKRLRAASLGPRDSTEFLQEVKESY